MNLSFEELWLQTKWSATCYDTLPHSIISFKEHDIEGILYEYLEDDMIRVLRQYKQIKLYGRK